MADRACSRCGDAAQAVLGASGDVPADTPTIRGWDFCHGRDLDGIMGSMIHTGFQATSFGQAIEEVNRMVCSMPTHACYPTEWPHPHPSMVERRHCCMAMQMFMMNCALLRVHALQ